VNSFCPVIRNTSSPHWRGWLQPENRRLVPANSFAEHAPEPLFSSINAPIICAGDHLLDWRFSDASRFPNRRIARAADRMRSDAALGHSLLGISSASSFASSNSISIPISPS
jgi:hypothetical protein